MCLGIFVISTIAGGDKSNGVQVVKKRKEHHEDNPEFILTQFSHPTLRKWFHDKLISRSVVTLYFVNIDNFENLAIYDKSLSNLLVDMGWTNALVLRKPYFMNLIKVFYSSMLISSQTINRVVTSIRRIPIEFDVVDLKKFLELQIKGWNSRPLEAK